MASERRRRRGDGDDGAVIVVIALSMMAIVIMASIVINLGGARHAREHDQDSADAIAIAGAAKLDPTAGSSQSACTAAWNYAVSNLGVGASPAPSCVNWAGSCVATTSRTISQTSGAYTLTFTNPVLDGSSFFGNQAALTADGNACKRFGVEISHSWQFPFGRGTQTVNVKSLALLGHATGTVDAPLVLLNQHDCNVMTIAGNSTINAQTTTGQTAYIAIDSDGSACPAGNKVIVDATGNAEMTAGGIAMWALSTGNTARAYDPADVGAGRAFYPGPVASSAPVGRSQMDWAYNCSSANSCPYSTPPYISNLVTADGGTGVPSGFTRWTSVYSCSPSNLVVPKGNWYIDCSSGLTMSGTNSLTFRGGDIVADQAFNISGNSTLRVNCDVATSTATCPTDPATTTTMYFRNGSLSKTGNVVFDLYETFAYMANGTVNLSGNSQLYWTAPEDPSSPFNNLLMWTESSTTISMTGTSDTTFDGILFAPNADLALTGDSGSNALGSQMFVNTASLTGNSTLNMAPHDDRILQLGGASASLIR
jgi:hypothetical protein